MRGRAAIITLGSELAEGLRIDTNGPELARRIERLGFQVDTLASASDVRTIAAQQIGMLCNAHQLVVCTGGLGPTHDDVTRDAVCDALGVRLRRDEAMVAFLESRVITSCNQQITHDVLKMADVFEGAEVLMPITGAAPGQVLPFEAGQLLVLPGPPKECMPLFEVFAQRFAEHAPAQVDFSIFGIPESEIQHTVEPLLPCGVEFTVLASPVEARVILTNRDAGAEAFEECAKAVRHAFGDCLFSDAGQTMAQVVLDVARQQGITIGCAESCTGGMIAAALTDVPGSSDVFMGGIVSYANEVKRGQLHVSAQDLESYGAVSSQVAAQMAQGACQALGVDMAVATTGVAGPGGGTQEKPVGTVWFGICDAQGTKTLLKHRGGDRATIREVSTQRALDLLRRRLLGLPLVSQFSL